MVTGRVRFAFGIGFAAVWAGCGARTAAWGMSCCCPSRGQSTEPLLREGANAETPDRPRFG